MTDLVAGARRLPLHHVTIQVPWHDGGLAGTVCSRPLDNTRSLVLPRTGKGRCDEAETLCVGKRPDELTAGDSAPFAGERVSFMAPFPLTLTKSYPYTDIYPETHAHFARTRFIQPPYSAACVLFRWMQRANVEGNENSGEIEISECPELRRVRDRESDVSSRSGEEVETDWVQEREKQLAMLDTLFGALRPEKSLCFLYARRKLLSEQSRCVIIGVGRVLPVGEATEYAYPTDIPPVRCVLWERRVGHSVRPGFAAGFLFPQQEALALAEREGVDPEEFVALAPDEHFDGYSFVSELLSHDGTVASLVGCAAALHRIRSRIEGPWDRALSWIDRQLIRMWKAGGAFPALGSALSALCYQCGLQHGSLLAFEIELVREKKGDGDPWKLLDAVMEDLATLGGRTGELLSAGPRKGSNRLDADRRALLELLARCAVSDEQALRSYDATVRADAAIGATDAELRADPQLNLERDQRSADPISSRPVGCGPCSDKSNRNQLTVPEPSRIDDSEEALHMRALVVELLEEAAQQGHTSHPRGWAIRPAEERALQPSCPLGEDILDAAEKSFGRVVARAATRGGSARELVDTERNDAVIDWTLPVNVHTQLRVLTKCTLCKHGYRSEKQRKSTTIFLEQTALLSEVWATA